MKLLWKVINIYMCAYTYIFIHIHIHIHTNINIYMYIYSGLLKLNSFIRQSE